MLLQHYMLCIAMNTANVDEVRENFLISFEIESTTLQMISGTELGKMPWKDILLDPNQKKSGTGTDKKCDAMQTNTHAFLYLQCEEKGGQRQLVCISEAQHTVQKKHCFTDRAKQFDRDRMW